MKTRELTPKIQLNVPTGTAPLMMELESFFEFSFWMAEELLDLEKEFADWHSPRPSSPAVTYDANGIPDNLQIDFENC